MSITVRQKTDYFTYVELGGEIGKCRSAEQIWNAHGISIKVQGTSPDGAGMNSFAKKHLIVVGATSKSQDPLKKAEKLAAKRIDAIGNKPRTVALDKTAKGSVDIKSYDMKTQKGRNDYKSAVENKKKSLESDFQTDVYEPATDITTLILMNDFGHQEIKDLFAAAILAQAPWADKDIKHVNIKLLPNTVVTITKGSPAPVYFNGFQAQVEFSGGLYHVTHCEKGANFA